MNIILIDWFFPAILGWILAVILNYLSDCLPYKRKLVPPFCQACGAIYSIINYLFSPRKCEVCGTYRRKRTWLFEIIFPFVNIWLWNNYPEAIGLVLSTLLLSYFSIIIIIDIEHHLILHITSIFGLILGILIGIKIHNVIPTITGGITGFLLMLFLFFFGRLFSKISSNIRKQVIDADALGFGDVILGGIIGLILGYPGIVIGLFLAILLGGLVSLVYLLLLIIIKKYHPNSALPYGPFLVISAFLLLFCKDFVNSFI
jgi:leader peptidase (prepilin peptidase) / N-methyltransferase